MKPDMRETLSRIERHVQEARSTASPKTAETLGLMAEAIIEIRTHTK